MALFVSLISPFLVLAGWFFVYRNSNRIAKRSESYALVTKALDKVLDIDKRCVEFWAGSKDKRESAVVWVAGTLSLLHGLRTLLEILEKHHGFPDKDLLMMMLRMSATLDAEYIDKLSDEQVAKKRVKQAEALSFALHSLYGYYRQKCD
ncbi:hypothetical protein [Pseudomonas sp. KU43P]|uniref:hypothetical protein n=1 Tax=Pseudomonas sp. KU43P TaxID=2487887 RepID=UPI0012A82AF7|nr:hypothetical protein [Pseudomonas sp. KU43P]BBH44713.1 hypothetical protein KU43P_11900 [Pseudomonas sp. KU43P]